jgi:hypothetical protein
MLSHRRIRPASHTVALDLVPNEVMLALLISDDAQGGASRVPT